MPNSTSSAYVVAVSGGVDSVVLLDALSRQGVIGRTDVWDGRTPGRLIVVHFDHGIRDDSWEDERFVRELAKQYGYNYYSRREELGRDASEEMARRRRYAFLREVARTHHATIVTAHHANDAVETVAINVTRGTGWRGLAVMDTTSIWRPLLAVTKQEIRDYAKNYGVQWREDSTNSSDAYLRNRIRRQLPDGDNVWQTLSLRARQIELKRAIDEEAMQLIGDSPYSRYFFTHCGDTVAVELLRAVFLKETGMSPTLPARKRVLHAIKVARSGTVTPVSDGIYLTFTRTHFIVETRAKVIS